MVRHGWVGTGRLAAPALAVLLAGCAAASAAAPPRPAARSGDGAALAALVDPVERLPPEAFTPLEEPAELGPLLADLSAWWDRFFRPEASPRRAQTVALAARAGGDGAPDLVRASYEMAVARLEVLDAAGFTLVRVADPGIDVADGAAAQVILRRVLDVEAGRSWRLHLPARLEEGVWYASAAGDLAAATSWRDRIDVRVLGGRLELLCHKRGEGERPAPDAWFPPELRARLGRR